MMGDASGCAVWRHKWASGAQEKGTGGRILAKKNWGEATRALKGRGEGFEGFGQSISNEFLEGRKKKQKCTSVRKRTIIRKKKATCICI